jgi:Domain of unknown function (DUF4276)
MTVVLLVEGATETALKTKLKEFLDMRAEMEGKPKVRFQTRDIMSLNPERLLRRVQLELERHDVTAVVGLIDVYPQFRDADEAKRFLREAVGNEPHFYPHAAQFDVEAWLLPYWDAICQRVGVQQNRPGSNPEQVNDQNPPSKRLQALYQRAKPKPRKYIKQNEMAAILHDKDLAVAAAKCGEFKSLLDTLLMLSELKAL